MATGTRYEHLASGQIRRVYERSTGETVHVEAPIYFKEDFLDQVTGLETDAQWAVTETGTSVTVQLGTDAAGENGIVVFTGTNNNEDQVAALHFSDDHRFGVGATTTSKYAQFEARIKWVPASTMEGLQIFVGLMGDLPTLTGTGGWEAATEYCGFLIGQDPEDDADDLSIFCASDDTATALNVDSGTDSAGDWLNLRVDVSDKTNLKFYINGTRVAQGTTFDFSTLAAGTEAVMQPVIGYIKHTTEADGNYGVLSLDSVQFWSTR